MSKNGRSHSKRSSKSGDKKDIYKIVTDNIIAALESGVAPWRKPWRSARNLVTGKEYRGYNAVSLGFSEFESPYWLTIKQANDLGGLVIAGSKSRSVVFWKWWIDGEKDPVTGEVEPLPDGKKHCTSFYFNVFNIEQTQGIPADAIPQVIKTEGTIEECERIVGGFANHPVIHHGGSVACYSPLRDRVDMPKIATFDRLTAYYSTLFHELTHSTGHKSRLGRFEGMKILAKFGSEDYSKEELIAEFGAAMLCGMAGIYEEQGQSAAYIENWLKVLKNDRHLLVDAAQAAQKAADHILGKKFEKFEPEVKAKSNGKAKVKETITVSHPLEGVAMADYNPLQLPDRTNRRDEMFYTPDHKGFISWGDYRRRLQVLASEWSYETSKDNHPLMAYLGRDWKRRYNKAFQYPERPKSGIRWVGVQPNGTIQLPSECGGRGPLPWDWDTAFLEPEHTWAQDVHDRIYAITVPQYLVDGHIKLQAELEKMGWDQARRQDVGTMTWKREDHTVLRVLEDITKNTKARRNMTKAELAVSTPGESPDEYIAAVKTAAHKIGLPVPRKAKVKAEPKPKAVKPKQDNSVLRANWLNNHEFTKAYLGGELDGVIEYHANGLLSGNAHLSPNRARELAAAKVSSFITADWIRLDRDARSFDWMAELYAEFDAAMEKETWRAALVRLTGTRTLIVDENPDGEDKPEPKPLVTFAPAPKKTKSEPKHATIVTKTLTFDGETMDVLRNIVWSHDHMLAVITDQLERPLYLKVQKAIEAMGGKWNRKDKGHRFMIDPRDKVEGLLNDGQLVVEKDGFFETPTVLAARMVERAHLRKGDRVLEPSAGLGAIAKLIEFDGAVPVCVERDGQRANVLGDLGYEVDCADFFHWAPVNGEKFDAVIMNPPFERGADMDHIIRAFEMLKPGGRLVAVCSEGPFFRSDAKAESFRTWIDDNKGASEKLPEGSFKSSGTMVNVRLVVVDKAPEKTLPRPSGRVAVSHDVRLLEADIVRWVKLTNATSITHKADCTIYAAKDKPSSKEDYKRLLTLAHSYGGIRAGSNAKDPNEVYITWKKDGGAFLVHFHKDTNKIDITYTSPNKPVLAPNPVGVTKWTEEALRVSAQAKEQLDDAFPRHQCPVCGMKYGGDGEKEVCDECHEVVGHRTVEQYRTELMGDF